MDKMLITDNNYNLWVERFMNSETTIAEEQELFAYFSRATLPSEAEKYRKMFEWYSSLSSQEVNHNVPNPKKSSIKLLPLRPWQWASIAAMIAILFTIGFNLRSSFGVSNDDYVYAGYIIRDGHKITDPDIVFPEFERISHELDSRITALDAQFYDYEFTSYDDIPSIYDLSSPESAYIETSYNFK